MEKKKIKILYFITAMDTGGAEMLLKLFLEKIDRDNFEPLVVSIMPTGWIGEDIQKSGIEVFSLQAKSKFNPLLFFKLLRLVKNENPDIIHSHLFHANLVARFLKIFFPKIKVISTEHNENVGGSFRIFLMSMSKGLSDKTIAVSEAVKRKLLEKKITVKEKIITIYNGIPTAEEKEYVELEKEIMEAGPGIISVGRLSKAKGYGYLIEAMPFLVKKYPNIILYILGEGEERESLEKQIENLSLRKNVFLLGNKKNVSDYLKKADLFISSSIHEGLPTVILEAMRARTLVMATKIGGTDEIIIDGQNGFLTEKENPKKLAERIIFALEIDKEKRDEIVRNAQEDLENKFSLQRMTGDYEKLYKKLADL